MGMLYTIDGKLTKAGSSAIIWCNGKEYWIENAGIVVNRSKSMDYICKKFKEIV